MLGLSPCHCVESFIDNGLPINESVVANHAPCGGSGLIVEEWP